MKKWLKRIGIGFACLIMIIGVTVFVMMQMSKFPSSMNMGMGMSGNMNMSNNVKTTSVTSLTQSCTNAPIKKFTLVAENKTIHRAGQKIQGYTFNGASPGPTLVINQGDCLEVHLINHASVGVTIHWHGVNVPNADDGVAGVTQNVVPPKGKFTYRFVVNKPGTYWYHSHQESYKETDGGLFGVLIVNPKVPEVHYDRDYVATLHDWGKTVFTVNDTSDGAHFAAKPGEFVRLRIVNSGDNEHDMTLVGALFKVIAIDANNINKPTDISNKTLPIAPSQRYDIVFQMPKTGVVKLINVDSGAASQFTPDSSAENKMLNATFGSCSIKINTAQVRKWKFFDYSTYGIPVTTADGLSNQTQFNVVDNIILGNSLGFYNGAFTMKFTMNGKTMENLPPLMVKLGDKVKIHFDNPTNIPHAMHLHGHDFIVLDQNGHPMSGSPIYMNTVMVNPHESVDIAFVANNPGLWMLHCHMLGHAYNGMDMAVDYQGVTTPYRVGSASGNFPD
ncbi:multicopper oxidase family protein [Heyndrickxia acidicola]|uniref:Copper-containing nitrite reductase n=1 Tax=Heyndrickxia acidicola TaxID=209389 RepID=A0ABU6MAY6_9BACI|nr:multicopper oxidase family protein [Heyndrickxia acidicola]MED1201833.1 multicopper oxidase family protein [Heyndrickxia acidicola]